MHGWDTSEQWRAHAPGVPLQAAAAAMAAFAPLPQRLQPRRSQRGALVLDDSYNASPESMRAAVDALCALDSSGRRVAVLGALAGCARHTWHACVRFDMLYNNAGLI